MHGVLLRLSSKLYERLSLQELQLLYTTFRPDTIHRRSTGKAHLLPHCSRRSTGISSAGGEAARDS